MQVRLELALSHHTPYTDEQRRYLADDSEWRRNTAHFRSVFAPHLEGLELDPKQIGPLRFGDNPEIGIACPAIIHRTAMLDPQANFLWNGIRERIYVIRLVATFFLPPGVKRRVGIYQNQAKNGTVAGMLTYGENGAYLLELDEMSPQKCESPLENLDAMFFGIMDGSKKPVHDWSAPQE